MSSSQAANLDVGGSVRSGSVVGMKPLSTSTSKADSSEEISARDSDGAVDAVMERGREGGGVFGFSAAGLSSQLLRMCASMDGEADSAEGREDDIRSRGEEKEPRVGEGTGKEQRNKVGEGGRGRPTKTRVCLVYDSATVLSSITAHTQNRTAHARRDAVSGK